MLDIPHYAVYSTPDILWKSMGEMSLSHVEVYSCYPATELTVVYDTIYVYLYGTLKTAYQNLALRHL
jgi:hypothetical protein